MSTITVGDFISTHLIMDRTVRKKINKDIEDINEA